MPTTLALNDSVIAHCRCYGSRVARQRTLLREGAAKDLFRVVDLPVAERQDSHVRAHDLRIEIVRSLQRVLNRERLAIRDERGIEMVRVHVRDRERVVQRRRLRMIQPRQCDSFLNRGAVRCDGAVEVALCPEQPALDDEALEPLGSEALRIARPEIQRERQKLCGPRDISSLQLRIRELLACERDGVRIGAGACLLQKSFEQRHLAFEVFQRSVEIAERLHDLAGEIRVVAIFASTRRALRSSICLAVVGSAPCSAAEVRNIRVT